MSPKTVKTVAIVVLVVVAVAGAATVAYALQQRRIDQLTAQMAARDARIDSLTDRVTALDSALASATAAGQSSSQPAEQTPAPTEVTEPEPAEPTVSRQFSFVRKSSNKNGKVSLVLDFAQFLTGDAAAKAAAEAGDESPPPNDYYIANVNLKLRTFSVAKDATFVVAGSDPDDKTTLTAKQFHAAIKSNTDGAKDAPYWFTISNGVVTAGEEEWLP